MHPLLGALHVPAGVERLASPVVLLSAYAVALLALLGVAAQAGLLPSSRAPAVVWAVPALMVLPALALFGLARYRAPADPFLVMLAAAGIVAAFEGARSSRAVTPPLAVISVRTSDLARKPAAASSPRG